MDSLHATKRDRSSFEDPVNSRMAVSFFKLISLREIDIELMKRLSPRINVIPVVGKADTFTPTELADFKKRVR